jgi:hypothetical protein
MRRNEDNIADSCGVGKGGSAPPLPIYLLLLRTIGSAPNARHSLALLKVTTLNELVELSSAPMQKPFEAMSEQTKELAALAQKRAAAMTESMKTGITNPLNKNNEAPCPECLRSRYAKW